MSVAELLGVEQWIYICGKWILKHMRWALQNQNSEHYNLTLLATYGTGHMSRTSDDVVLSLCAWRSGSCLKRKNQLDCHQTPNPFCVWVMRLSWRRCFQVEVFSVVTPCSVVSS
jgi:hypothetical protein